MKINNFLTSKKIIEILFIILPIGLLFSNTLSESILIILLLISFFKIKLKQFLLITKNLLIFLLILFWLYLIINYLINYEKNPSIERTFFFIRFPLYILAIHYFINYLKININKIFYYWTIILLIIFFDLIFQYFNEKNILGYQSIQQGNIFRLGGFLDDELKIANLIFHFAGLIFSYYFSKNYNTSKNKTFLCLIFLFISLVIIFLTGERSNFITSAFFS